MITEQFYYFVEGNQNTLAYVRTDSNNLRFLATASAVKINTVTRLKILLGWIGPSESRLWTLH